MGVGERATFIVVTIRKQIKIMLHLLGILFYMDTLCGLLTCERRACLNSNWNWKLERVYHSRDFCSHPRILKIKPSPSPHFKHLLTLLGNNLEKPPPLPWRECAYIPQ